MKNTSKPIASGILHGLALTSRRIRLVRLLVGSFCFALLTSSIQAVILDWDANSESDIAGYRVRYGTSSGNHSSVVDVGNSITATLSNLTVGTTYYFVVTAYNTAALESLPSNEVSVTVAPPGGNTAPTISNIADQTINEDASTAAVAFTIGDGETAAGSLTITGYSSNLALVPNTNIVFGGSGVSRTVTVTPAANQNGTTTIMVTLSDGALTANDTFILTVTADNGATILTVAQFDSVNGLTLRIEGPQGQQYSIEASGNLQVWTQIGTITTNVGPSFFTDPTATGYQSRFYRLKQPSSN